MVQSDWTTATNDHGFDHWFTTQNNCLPNHRPPYNFVRNGIPLGPLQGYAVGIVTNEAVFWLSELQSFVDVGAIDTLCSRLCRSGTMGKRFLFTASRCSSRTRRTSEMVSG